MYVSKNQKDWDTFIPAALFAFRTSPSETTRESPFYLLYGREPRLPPIDPASSIAEHRSRIVKQIELGQRIAHENTQRARQKMKAQYDKTAQEPNFLEGIRVWVFTPKTFKGLSKKLLHNWHGPYRIVEQLSPVHYRLRTCSNRPVTTTVHANRMKPFYDPTDRPIDPPENDIFDEVYLGLEDIPTDSFDLSTDDHPNPEPAVPDTDQAQIADPIQNNDVPTPGQPKIDNETVFNAEKILRHRVQNGQTQYLVKWSGYPTSDATWEPEENLFDPRLLENYQN